MSDADTRGNLDAFFAPRTVAVVGASRDPAKIGHLVLKYLLESDARVYPVNPSAGEILGRPCYPDLASIPEDVDLAVLAVPAPATVEMVRQCVEKGVRAIIGQASGFGETGEEGRRLEEQIKGILSAVPAERRPRFLGPNTLGVYVPRRRLDTTFTLRERSPRPGPGDIAFISQSGATAVCIMEAAASLGVGLSAFAGIGNKLDVDENELLDYFAEDPHTRAIAFYLESFRDGRGFLERCRRITPHTPVVVLKTGRSAAGARAAALHTGSLVGSDRVVEGALRQVGAFRAYDEEELVDMARALGHGRPLPGKRVAVLTTAGGLGVIATDLLESRERGAGLELATLSEQGRGRLRSALVPFAAVENPVDLTANSSNEHYAASLEVLEAEAGVDAVLCVMQFQSPFVDDRLAGLIMDRFHHGPKPMVVVTIGGELSQRGLRQVVGAGVPAYPSLRRAVRALAALYERGLYLSRQRPGPEAPAATAAGHPSPLACAGQAADDPRKMVRPGVPLAEHQVKDLLATYGIPVPPRLVLQPGDASRPGNGSGRGGALPPGNLPFPYPVVVKTSAPDILHKTELGGVRLGIRDRDELDEALAAMGARFPGKTLVVEAQEPPGVEAIVGFIHDATFGPSLMVGLGGIFTELYQDVAFRVAPITAADARDMIQQLRGGHLFDGFRGIRAGREALVSVLMGMSRLAEDLGDHIEQMDLNPVIIYPDRAVVVDAKLRVR
ncbi:MAG: acetate--CoA ligase family protein [Bacillota bacterium]|nr:acetate--CoA ligase family protein [Bacillota bacterium]